MSEEWVAVAKVQDLGAGEMKAARAGDEDVVVYNLDGDFYATHGICTHAYAMLVDGFVRIRHFFYRTAPFQWNLRAEPIHSVWFSTIGVHIGVNETRILIKFSQTG